MNPRQWILALAAVAPACDCESSSDAEPSATESDGPTSGTSSTSGTSGSLTSSTGAADDESTGAPFDASRWVGRYHYAVPSVDPWGNPHEAQMLVNFTIFEDRTAMMLVDHCSRDAPYVVMYAWEPDESGWLELHPGAGESSLRFLSMEGVNDLRVQLIEPCRYLEFWFDMKPAAFLPVAPGASCWVNRCEPGELEVVYCEGEEPPSCP